MTRPVQFSLESLILLTLISAVAAGLAALSPLLGMVFAAFAALALVRTAFAARRVQFPGGFSTSRTYFRSLGIVVSAVALSCITLIISVALAVLHLAIRGVRLLRWLIRILRVAEVSTMSWNRLNAAWPKLIAVERQLLRSVCPAEY